MIIKICTKCGEEKELSEFYKNNASKIGLRSMCKKCILIRGKNYRDNNKEELTKRQKLYDDNHKEEKKLWRDSRKDKTKKATAKWYNENKDQKLESVERWRKENPEIYTEIKRRHGAKRKRNLGYVPINNKKSGYVGHHINRNDIIYIPEHIHKSIPHRQDDLVSMEQINTLAMGYL